MERKQKGKLCDRRSQKLFWRRRSRSRRKDSGESN